VPHYRHPYLMVDLGLAWATTIVQVRPQDGDQVEGLLERLIALLTAPESHNERLKPQSQLFLFRVYSLRGHLRTRQQRFAEAIDDFVLARDAFRVYAARTAEREVLPSGWYNHEIAHMFNNQAYTQARAGDLVGALASSRKVLDQYVTGVSSYYRALFYNTFALIAIMDDQLVEARDALDKARRAAADSEVQRAIGLVKLAEATLARKEMNRDGHVNPEIEEYYEAAALLLKSEPSRVCEVYDDHARFARDIAFLYAQRGEHEMVLAYRRRALELLDAAVAQLPPTPSLQLADLLETRVTVLNNLGEYDQAAKVLSYAESLMYVHMPQYSQVLAGKFALQHAIIAQRGRQEYSEALRWCAVALARAMVFAPQHHDLRAFETIVRRLLRDTPPEEVTRHWQVLGEEQLYVSAGELRYQRPSPNAWSRAWERAVNLLRVLVDEVRPLERQS
jgi:tetratricopeptide (TPR) repeat protein